MSALGGQRVGREENAGTPGFTGLSVVGCSYSMSMASLVRAPNTLISCIVVDGGSAIDMR